MQYKPFKSIYNLIALDKNCNKLFGRHVRTKKQAKSEIINSPYLLKIDTVIYKNTIYNMKEIFLF